ncbi:hypothetical protein [Leadbetterella byssophila]|uniref:hypothetical protein n=1 Tax=Leadbetterella byssophila TaxID=316068 RepID=UPI00399F3BE9
MKTLFQLLAFIWVFSSCEKADTLSTDTGLTKATIDENEIPYTTLQELSPGFVFVIRSMVTVGSKPAETHMDFPYMAIINDQDTYLQEIHSIQEYPAIDYSTHTLLAIGLETRGDVQVNPIKDGDKIILKVRNKIDGKGPQGVIPRFFSAIIPKTDSANLSMEIKVIKEK